MEVTSNSNNDANDVQRYDQVNVYGVKQRHLTSLMVRCRWWQPTYCDFHLPSENLSSGSR